MSPELWYDRCTCEHIRLAHRYVPHVGCGGGCTACSCEHFTNGVEEKDE